MPPLWWHCFAPPSFPRVPKTVDIRTHANPILDTSNHKQYLNLFIHFFLLILNQ